MLYGRWKTKHYCVSARLRALIQLVHCAKMYLLVCIIRFWGTETILTTAMHYVRSDKPKPSKGWVELGVH